MKQGALSRDIFKRLLAYLLPYKGRFVLALLAMVGYGATDGVLPFLIKKVLDDIFGAHNKELLIPFVGFLVVFALVRGFFGFFQKYLSAKVGLDVIKDLRNTIDAHLLTLSPGFFNRHVTGSLISRVTNDTLLVRMAVTDAAASLLRESIRLVALLAAAIYLDPVLALIAFVGFPLCILPIIKFGKKVRSYSKVGQDKLGGLTGILQETIVGHKVVQAFSMRNYEVERFKKENAELTKTYIRAEKYGALSQPTNEIIASFAIAGVILYGGFSVISGVRTQGDFIAFITAMFLMYEPVKKLGRINTVVQTGIAAAERIFEILDTQPEVRDKEDAVELKPDSSFIIAYEDVCFRYAKFMEEGRQWILEGVSLEVEAGETLALVGTSGGGKTTLVELLPRFYDPNQGLVKIGGRDIRDYSLDSLRGAMAIVSQHTFLFHDTLYHNITYGKPGASLAEVQQAARAANAHEFISRLPQGYDTCIGEMGLTLSGGERQRVAIARALLKDSPILILDEATAALDSESEYLVQSAIDNLMEGRTVLVIAHRLSTVRKASKIAVISAGRIVEAGTHDELLAQKGEYAKLHSMQFRDESPPLPKALSAGA